MTDWSPIAERNPVEGDPWRLGELANHFGDRAQNIRDVIRGLERVDAGEGEMRSVAVDALVARRGELIPRLGMLEARYESAAGALRAYCPVLDHAQEMAGTAQRDSSAAQREIERCQREIEARAAQTPVPGAPPLPPAPGPSPEEDLRAAQSKLDGARGLLDEAVETRDRGERTAAERIDDAADDDLRNPDRGFFGSIGHGLASTGSWVVDRFDSLQSISETLGYISGALALIGFVFPPAGLLGAAVGAVKLGIDVTLMARGEGSWMDIATGVIGLATFGLGRVATSAARASAGREALTRSLALRSTVGQAGALAGRSGLSETGVRLTGAAYRANQLRRLSDVTRSFGGEATRATLPRVTHALTRLRPLELPARQMLDFCPSAVRAANLASVANAGATMSDVYSVGETGLKVIAAAAPTVSPIVSINQLGQADDASDVPGESQRP